MRPRMKAQIPGGTRTLTAPLWQVLYPSGARSRRCSAASSAASADLPARWFPTWISRTDFLPGRLSCCASVSSTRLALLPVYVPLSRRSLPETGTELRRRTLLPSIAVPIRRAGKVTRAGKSLARACFHATDSANWHGTFEARTRGSDVRRQSPPSCSFGATGRLLPGKNCHPPEGR